LREQWYSLTGRLRDIDAVERRHEPSGLGSWSVGDLIAHLGYGIAMIVEIEPASSGTRAISVGQYLAGYQAAASTIEHQTQQLNLRLGEQLLDGIESMAQSAWHSLERRRPSVVVGRRGPLVMDDYLLTRLIELVIHGDDLHRAIGAGTRSPVLGTALVIVSDALAAAHLEMHGVRPENRDPLTWVRQASGRAASGGTTASVLG